MGKSINNLYRYAEIAKASNKRYLDALVDIIPVKSVQEEIQKVCTRKTEKVKAFAGFNVWEKETLQLFRVISDGKYLLSGFTNKTVRQSIYPTSYNDRRNRNIVIALEKY